jgi:precorrin-6B methylase 2
MNLDYLPTGLYKEGHMLPNPETLDLWRNLKKTTDYKNILEIGLNAGHSSAIQLELFPDIKLISLDIGRHDITREAVKVLSERFPDRFESIICHSTAYANRVMRGEYPKPEVDAVFIDGGHTEKDVVNDLMFCKWLNVKDVFIDDADSTTVAHVVRAFEDKGIIYKVQEHPYECEGVQYKHNRVDHIRFN